MTRFKGVWTWAATCHLMVRANKHHAPGDVPCLLGHRFANFFICPYANLTCSNKLGIRRQRLFCHTRDTQNRYVRLDWTTSRAVRAKSQLRRSRRLPGRIFPRGNQDAGILKGEGREQVEGSWFECVGAKPEISMVVGTIVI